MGLRTSADTRKAFKTQHYTNRTENIDKKTISLRGIHALEPGISPSPLPCFLLLASGCLEAVVGKVSTLLKT